MTDAQIIEFAEKSNEADMVGFNARMEENDSQFRIFVTGVQTNTSSGLDPDEAADSYIESNNKEYIGSQLTLRGIGGKVPC